MSHPISIALSWLLAAGQDLPPRAAAAPAVTQPCQESPVRQATTRDMIFCGKPQSSIGDFDRAVVAVWEAGDAPWSQIAAIDQRGVVLVTSKNGSGQVRELHAPKPIAYGRFGSQVASNDRFLATTETRRQRVYIFDLAALDKPPLILKDVDGFADTITFAGDELFVGGKGELRIYKEDVPGAERRQSLHRPGLSVSFRGRLLPRTASWFR